MITFTADLLSKFKEELKGRRLYLLFYSASIEPTAKVLTVEITLDAFEMLLKSHNVKSFVAEFGHIVTIENIVSPPITFSEPSKENVVIPHIDWY